jgi:hypothetical protein
MTQRKEMTVLDVDWGRALHYTTDACSTSVVYHSNGIKRTAVKCYRLQVYSSIWIWTYAPFYIFFTLVGAVWSIVPQIPFIYILNSVLSKIWDYSVQGFLILYYFILCFRYSVLHCSDCKLLKSTLYSYKLKSVFVSAMHVCAHEMQLNSRNSLHNQYI